MDSVFCHLILSCVLLQKRKRESRVLKRIWIKEPVATNERRLEATRKSTDHLEAMVKRVIRFGVKADYILMDSWFCWPAILARLGAHLPVICVAKNMPKVFYRHQEQWVSLGKLYTRLKKRRGEARILASVGVETKHEQKVEIVFIRHRHKRDWLAIVSTNIDSSADEIVRIYGKRWDIDILQPYCLHKFQTIVFNLLFSPGNDKSTASAVPRMQAIA